MNRRSRVSITCYPPVTNCTSCDNLLVGRDDDMPAYSVQGYRTGVWLAEFLCEPCACEVLAAGPNPVPALAEAQDDAAVVAMLDQLFSSEDAR